MKANTRERNTISGAGEVERSFNKNPFGIVKCECGRRHVTKVGKKCVICRREEKDSKYCPNCNQAWIVHNDDGSCVKD